MHVKYNLEMPQSTQKIKIIISPPRKDTFFIRLAFSYVYPIVPGSTLRFRNVECLSQVTEETRIQLSLMPKPSFAGATRSSSSMASLCSSRHLLGEILEACFREKAGAGGNVVIQTCACSDCGYDRSMPGKQEVWARAVPSLCGPCSCRPLRGGSPQPGVLPDRIACTVCPHEDCLPS